MRALVIIATICTFFTADAMWENVKQAYKRVKSETSSLSDRIFHKSSKALVPAIVNNPYKDTAAIVRVGNEVNEGEQAYLHRRLPFVYAALSQVLDRDDLTDQNTPIIACCYSGGGDRAACITTGIEKGLAKEHLYNAIAYAASLSGSTWTIGPRTSMNISPKQFGEFLKQVFEEGFLNITYEEKKEIMDVIRVKKSYNQPITPVDIYGKLIGQRLLNKIHKDQTATYTSDQAHIVEDGHLPYPIYTAVDASKKQVEDPTWYCITPHELEHIEHGTHIPIWAMGRSFYDGVSVPHRTKGEYPPEQHLDYVLGICGAAFGASLYDGWEELAQYLSPEVAEAIKTIIEPIEGFSLPFYGKIDNYTNGMENQPYHTRDHITLKDAGLSCNIPVPAFTHRPVDILIIGDASAGTVGGEFEKAVEYAHAKGIPFPTIDTESDYFKTIDKRTLSVFKPDQQNPHAPVVIYMPPITDPALWEEHKSNPSFKKYNLDGVDLETIANKGFARTINFSYTAEESALLMNHAEFAVRANKDTIIEAINWVVDRKSEVSA